VTRVVTTIKETTMNLRHLPLLIGLALCLGAPPLNATSHDQLVTGQVTKVDESAQKITIKHGPLRKFDMADGMTMVFRAADPAMLKQVKPGDRIKFVPERINGQFTVTRIEKAR
jgi:Cu(I)/Ag(I) efflux system periplasmic protein CusF